MNDTVHKTHKINYFFDCSVSLTRGPTTMSDWDKPGGERCNFIIEFHISFVSLIPGEVH